MYKNNDFSLWAQAHKAYDINGKNHIVIPEWYQHKENLTNLIGEINKTMNGSPFWSLLHWGSFFQQLQSKTVHLLHTTTHLEKIVNSSHIYSSSWCLVGSMYCTPAYKIQNDEFRLHNLWSYISTREAPLALSVSRGNNKEMKVNKLLIEVELPEEHHMRPVGIDYMQLWNIHYSIFKNLEYLLSSQERYQLKNLITEKVRSSIEILHRTQEWLRALDFEDSESYVNAFQKSISSLPILWYIYFESVSEYLQLFSNDKISQFFASKWELNNWHYKSLLLWLYANLVEKFNLWLFSPTLQSLEQAITALTSRSMCNVDFKHMIKYLHKRLTLYISTIMFWIECHNENFNWINVEWEFEELARNIKPLLWHLIHRELRNFWRYPDFYYYYEQEKALRVRNYRNNMNIVFTFNWITPKWEVGINPAFSNLQYKIFQTEDIINENWIDLHIKKTKQLEDISIVPRLVDVRNSFMRL